MYWSGSSTEQERERLSETITSLAKLNLQDMKAKDSQAQFMGLTGAWAMGLLLLFSVGLQIYFRNKTMSVIIEPIEHLTTTLDAYSCGNKHRRLLQNSNSIQDLKKVTNITNGLLDDLNH